MFLLICSLPRLMVPLSPAIADRLCFWCWLSVLSGIGFRPWQSARRLAYVIVNLFVFVSCWCLGIPRTQK